MLKLRFALMLCLALTGQASAATLDRALNCKLTAEELPRLMSTLRAEDIGFTKPVAQLALPTMDVFKLAAPLAAHGATADEVVIGPTRIALVVRGTTSQQLAQRLKLKRPAIDGKDEYLVAFTPWRRGVMAGYTNILAYQSSHDKLAGAAMVGCEYKHPDAAQWPGGASAEELLKFMGLLNPSEPKD